MSVFRRSALASFLSCLVLAAIPGDLQHANDELTAKVRTAMGEVLRAGGDQAQLR